MGKRAVRVSGELWQEICTVGWSGTSECVEGLPEGATFCNVAVSLLRELGEGAAQISTLAFIFEHPDWPEVEGKVPVVNVVHLRVS